MTQVDLQDAQAHLAELVDAVLRGEEVMITQKDRPTVRLVPVVPVVTSRRAGSAKGKILMADDFDTPLDDFKEYME